MSKIDKIFQQENAKFIPLLRNEKRPATAFKDKTFSSDELNQHFHNGGNFGLLCEHKFFFVDIDVSHGANGLLNFGQWLTENNMVPDDILSKTLRARTPTGGIHLVFKQDSLHHFKQDIGVIDGVDLKASPNNFIVVAPSRIDGKPYEWVNADDIDKIQVVPKQLIEAFEKMAKHKNTEKKGRKVSSGETFINAYGKEHLDLGYYLINGFGEEGTRNENLFAWALQARKVMSQESAVDLAIMANDKSQTPISDESEIDRTIDSAYNYEITKKPVLGTNINVLGTLASLENRKH